jgi:hypothetical protein
MKKSDKMRLLLESLQKASFFKRKHVEKKSEFKQKDNEIELLEEVKEEIKPIKKRIVKRRN